MLGGVMTTLSSMTNVTHRHTSESSSKENVCAKGAYLIILCVEGLFYITNILVLFFFVVAHFCSFAENQSAQSTYATEQHWK